MALSPLTAQLPATAGALPDLFRRTENAAVRRDDAGGTASGSDAATGDEQRALAARASDDTARLLARRAALGPITYGRRPVAADAPQSAPIGMRGVHLDVRG
jgi:hypothetical protein